RSCRGSGAPRTARSAWRHREDPEEDLGGMARRARRCSSCSARGRTLALCADPRSNYDVPFMSLRRTGRAPALALALLCVAGGAAAAEPRHAVYVELLGKG